MLIYIRNLLSSEEYSKIREICGTVIPCMKRDSSSEVVRYRYTFGADDYVSRVFSGLRDLPGSPTNSTSVEYRYYGVGGMMDWHRDTQLYDVPQYELVFTVDNTSDSETQWIDERSGELRSLRTEPNSLMIVRAGGVLHRVTPVSRGGRSIIKFVRIHKA